LEFKIPKIAEILDTARRGVIPQSWWKRIAGKVDHSIFWKDGDIFWRVLVDDRDSDGNSPPPWYRRACVELFDRGRSGDLVTMELLENPSSEEDSHSAITVAFLKRVQSVTWNKRLVVLENSCFGLVPENTLPDDRVFILRGCDVPIVLRKEYHSLLREWGTIHAKFYTLVGEAYIHGDGIMNGDAVRTSPDMRPYSLK
jgi:hypothetical protein